LPWIFYAISKRDALFIVQCLEQANRTGIRDANLLGKIGIAHMERGLYHEARPILQRAVACAQANASYDLLAAFGETLSGCSELEAARQQWGAARAAAKDARQLAVADAAIEKIDVGLGHVSLPQQVSPAVGVAH
jgi:tetratricopeptide (TPR) repeat protein